MYFSDYRVANEKQPLMFGKIHTKVKKNPRKNEEKKPEIFPCGAFLFCVVDDCLSRSALKSVLHYRNYSNLTLLLINAGG